MTLDELPTGTAVSDPGWILSLFAHEEQGQGTGACVGADHGAQIADEHVFRSKLFLQDPG